MKSTANNPYEEAARLAKALKLIQVFRDIEATADQVARMTDEQWTLAAKAAEVREASAETRRMVVDALARPRVCRANPIPR